MFEERMWTGGGNYAYEARLRDGRQVRFDDISPDGLITETKFRNVGEDGLILEQRNPSLIRAREIQMERQSQFIVENDLPSEGHVWTTDTEALFEILTEIRTRLGIGNIHVELNP